MSAKNLARHISTKMTPQTMTMPGRESDQVRNLAGGHSFAVDNWTRLDRFLLLGTESGAYYARERELTLANAGAVRQCMMADGPRAVARIVEISASGRAAKNDAALLSLAIAAKQGDDATRRLALAALPEVARTSTHLFAFAEMIEALGGWGRGTRTAVARWYGDRTAEQLSHQVIKYRQRNGWTHTDLLRLAHAKPPTSEHDAIYRWIVRREDPGASDGVAQIRAFDQLQATTTPRAAADLVRSRRLPREAVPTQLLDSVELWEALSDDMPVTALIRNLATMTRVGLLTPRSAATERVVAQLADAGRLARARIHPMNVLIALRTYALGHGLRGRHTWTPVQAIVDALDDAFYATFDNVVPTGLRQLVAVDCSASMMAGGVAGVPTLSARETAAAMALIALRTEPNAEVIGFTTGHRELRISPRQRLDDVLKHIGEVARPEGTDCSVPMQWAVSAGADVDLFSIYTDGQTWAGQQHPVQALNRYRTARVAGASMVSVAFVGYGDSIVDGSDAGMLDVIGFDTAAPALIADFARGRAAAHPGEER